MEASWVLIFSAFPVLQEASFPTFLLKTFHFQKLVLESESRYIVGCFICSTFNYISVFLSHLKADMGSSHVFRIIEQCCFNSVSDPFNG